MPKAVVLDTNALLMPFQFKLNIDHELRRLFGDVPVLVPQAVLQELGSLDDKHAKAAAALARKYESVDTDANGDDAVIEAAERRSAAVVTNDKKLIARLRERGITVVRLRGGRYLVASPH